MKFTGEHFDDKVTIEKKYDDLNIAEVMDMIEQLLVGMGFPEKVVQDGFKEKATEYGDYYER